MHRRRFLRFLSLFGLAGAAGGGWTFWRSEHNPWYAGPPSDHFDGLRFCNPDGDPGSTFASFMRWQIGGGREDWPASYPSNLRDAPPERVEGTDLRLSFVGHVTSLVQTAGLNILIDPVWSERASPLSFAGPKRVNAPGILFDDLPKIDLVLLTHNHYDHCDIATLSRLHRRDQPRLIAPLGNDKVLWARDPAIFAEAHDWGARIDIASGVAVHVEPAHHWSARGLFDRRMALWCAFVLDTPGGKIYAVSDTGYHDGLHYRAAKAKHGGFRLALLPIGAYEPRWFMQNHHQNPDEAVQGFLACGAAFALGHHWGTFRLTDEGIERPVEALAEALDRRKVSPERFRTLRPGASWLVPQAGHADA